MSAPTRLEDRDERAAPLAGNLAAIKAVAAAVQGTLGPKGLDVMLVDRHGDVVITNDGNTILERVDAAHPAARLLVDAARAQAREWGDGTTTTVVLTCALLEEAAAHVARGVPVTRLLAGMRLGIDAALATLARAARPIAGLDDPRLRQAALVAARGDEELADLCLQAATRIGRDRLEDPAFRLADWLLAREGGPGAVVPGVVLDKTPLSRQMPLIVRDAAVLCLDDALAPEEIDAEALGTDAGFAAYVRAQEEFRAGVRGLLAAGVRVVFIGKAVDAAGEDLLTEGGALAVRRLTGRDLQRVARHTGARLLKRAALRRPVEELRLSCGHAGEVRVDERAGQCWVLEGAGEPVATVLVGAATREVRAERLRVAEDAACAVQAALRGGVSPGGGAAELAALDDVRAVRETAGTMAAYGVDAVLAALRAPVARMAGNAGLNPLEQVEALLAARRTAGGERLGLDYETGAPTDMLEAGVVDPTPVRLGALRTAGEVAAAVLRIQTVIRMRDIAPASEGIEGQ